VNRFDEITAAAMDVADWTCTYAGDRSALAEDLIKLITLIAGGIGKGVAVDGEGDIGQGDCSCDDPDACSGDCDQSLHDAKAHNRYLIGERIQDAARTVRAETAASDLDRYGRAGLAPAWKPKGNAARVAVRPPDGLALRGRGMADFPTFPVHPTYAGPLDSRCGWLPGQASPDCDHDRRCPVHGDDVARRAGALQALADQDPFEGDGHGDPSHKA
jgi:hypothetical protein